MVLVWGLPGRRSPRTEIRPVIEGGIDTEASLEVILVRRQNVACRGESYSGVVWVVGQVVWSLDLLMVCSLSDSLGHWS